MGGLLVALVISGASWIYLLAFRGRFWRCDQRLSISHRATLSTWPSVWAIVPARNEATVLPRSMPALLRQQYPGSFQVLLVDDQSTDATATVARSAAQNCQTQTPLHIITTDPLPSGWSGKLWAVHQGVERVLNQDAHQLPDYFLLTDADILHGSNILQQLVVKAERDQLDLVSLMVLLRCQSFWEKLLIPAFIFFFQKLYPFPWVNEPQHPVAAAAGGCILVRRDILQAVGGIEVIRKALIDDCALGAAVKHNAAEGRAGRIWLGLTTKTVSLRPYPSLKTIWNMVARTAFTQLHYSFGLLLMTLVAMSIIYILPPVGMVLAMVRGQWLLALVAVLAWGLMTVAYWPTVRLYRLSPLWALTLPIIALLYTLMTLDSALRHLQGRGGAWKGRVYATETIK
jgi:hopene-associated glycosyltransferase HpnB